MNISLFPSASIQWSERRRSWYTLLRAFGATSALLSRHATLGASREKSVQPLHFVFYVNVHRNLPPSLLFKPRSLIKSGDNKCHICRSTVPYSLHNRLNYDLNISRIDRNEQHCSLLKVTVRLNL